MPLLTSSGVWRVTTTFGEEEQFILEAVNQKQTRFRRSITPRVHQKVVNLKGAAVALVHTFNHRCQLAVTVCLVEILDAQVVGDALDFTADVVFKYVGQLFQLGLAEFHRMVTEVLNGIVQINGVSVWILRKAS